ncbi:substrate-binding domain-containing protein [Lachnospiraceae bacterium LCP25S3_G4]
MKKKMFELSAMILCVVLVLCACASPSADIQGTDTSPITKNEDDQHQSNLNVLNPQAYSTINGLVLEPGSYISIIGRASDGAYWSAIKVGAERAVADMNTSLGYKGEDKIKINYSGPSKKDNVDEQVNILDEELARYPVAVGIAIIDTQACSVQFDLASENGIPIVAFDSGSDYDGIVSMVGTNNAEAAQTATNKMCTEIDDEGEIILIVNDSKSTTGIEREKVVREELEANHPNVSIVESIHLDKIEDLAKIIAAEKNQALQEGQQQLDPATLTEEDVMAYYFEKYPDIKGILCTNYDSTQLGLATSKTAGKKSEDFSIVGFDGGEAQLKALQSGDINGLVVQNPYGIGYATVVAASRAVLKMGNEAVVDTGYTWVTKDNMGEENIQKMLY